MDWERDGLFRPLLGVTREELEAYAARWNVPHVEDETNGLYTYDRRVCKVDGEAMRELARRLEETCRFSGE